MITESVIIFSKSQKRCYCYY